MARIRSIKPELRTSLTVGAWPREARYAWVLLWGYLDDYGRGKDDLRLVLADLFPLDRDVTERRLDGWLDLMCRPGPDDDVPALCRYEVDGRRYLHAVKWSGHQKVSHPRASRIPRCPRHASDRTTPDELPNGSGIPPEEDRSGSASYARAAPGEQGAREQGSREGEQGTRELPPAAVQDPPPPSHPQPETTTPPPRCLAHRHLPADNPGPACHACKTARLATTTAAEDATRRAELTRQRDVRMCKLCDADGRRLDTLGQAPLPERCDHQYRARPTPPATGRTELEQIRHQAETVPCDRCPAQAGDICIDDNGDPLPSRVPAHHTRIAAARAGKVPA